MENPNDDFIKFVIKERFKFKVTQQFINTARPLVQKSIQESITEIISEKFDAAILNPAKQELAADNGEIPSEEKRDYYFLRN